MLKILMLKPDYKNIEINNLIFGTEYYYCINNYCCINSYYFRNN